MPEPEQMTTGISQPFMRASEPAAAHARAWVSGSSPASSRVEPMLAPQLLRRPSSAMAVLHRICRPMRGSMVSNGTVSANVMMSFTLRTLLSCKLSSALAVSGFCSRTAPSFSM